MSTNSTDKFIEHWQWLELPKWIYYVPRQTEFTFSPERRWRLDLAWPLLMLGIEIHGGFYRGSSGHSSAAGVQRDLEKCNALQLSGWLTLYFPTSMLSGRKHRERLKDTLVKAFEWQLAKLEFNMKVEHGCENFNCDLCQTNLFRRLQLPADVARTCFNGS